MIAFEELVAALDQWRVRNGLPVASLDIRATGAPAAAAQAAAPVSYSYTPPPVAAVAPRPAMVPVQAPAAVVARPPTDSDVLALGEDEMVDEADVADVADAYDNEGDDYVVPFNAAAGHATAAPDEPTSMAAMPAAQAAPALQYVDDDDPGLDPALDPAMDPALDPRMEDDEFANSPPTPPAGTLAAAPISHDTLDAEDEILDEATVVGGDDRR